MEILTFGPMPASIYNSLHPELPRLFVSSMTAHQRIMSDHLSINESVSKLHQHCAAHIDLLVWNCALYWLLCDVTRYICLFFCCCLFLLLSRTNIDSNKSVVNDDVIYMQWALQNEPTFGFVMAHFRLRFPEKQFW